MADPAKKADPGVEIQLDVNSNRKFFAKVMSWREQKAYVQLVKEARNEESDDPRDDTIETEAVLAAIATRLTRTDPPIKEMTADGLSEVVDLSLIWDLHAAVKMNLSCEEKKS